jgi:hypothetical protein
LCKHGQSDPFNRLSSKSGDRTTVICFPGHASAIPGGAAKRERGKGFVLPLNLQKFALSFFSTRKFPLLADLAATEGNGEIRPAEALASAVPPGDHGGLSGLAVVSNEKSEKKSET